MALTAFNMSNPLGIGDSAPMLDRMMENVDGLTTSLRGEKDANGLLVIFTCNSCPYVLAWEDQYPKLDEIARKNRVGMVLVNSNERKRDGDDSMAKMRERAEEGNYSSAYVLDEGADLADAFGAQTTPHVFLFNSEFELVFQGSINDKFENREENVTREWLVDALNKVGHGKASEINPASTRQIGCSIKRD